MTFLNVGSMYVKLPQDNWNKYCDPVSQNEVSTCFNMYQIDL